MFSPHFDIKELVPKSIHDVYGNHSWWFLDHRAVLGLNNFRKLIGTPIIVNNWHIGGKLKLRGYRPAFTRLGSVNSQHKAGRAFDINAVGYTSDELYQFIINNERAVLHLGITTIESKDYTPTWTHIDFRYTGLDKLLIIKPKVKPNKAFKMKKVNSPENIFYGV